MKRVMTLDTLGVTATEVINKIYNLNLDTATLITISGDLGAGKTTLTQEIASKLGVKENIISPTFVIMKKYETIDTNFKYLVHVDAYRLEKSEELIKLGWQELLDDKKNLIILEWPEQVPLCIPENALNIKLSHIDDGTRRIEF